MTNRLLLCSLFGLLLLTSCTGGSVTPTPTAVVGAGEAAIALIQQQMYSNLTQQAIDNAAIQEGARQTATQRVVYATATQQAHVEAAAATRRADSATQQAFQVTVEAAKAQDTATAQAASAQATSTAEAQASATSLAISKNTQQAIDNAQATSDHKTEQAPIVAAKAKALEIETSKAELDLKRSQDTYWLSAYGGWLFALLLAIAAGFVLWKKSEIGVIADENGKVRIVLINKRALQPELMFNPVLDFSKKDQVTVPALAVPEETQRQIVHETKVVEAIKSLPPGYQRQAVGMTAGLTAQPAPAVNIQVVQPGSVQGWLDDVQGQMSEQVEE